MKRKKKKGYTLEIGFMENNIRALLKEHGFLNTTRKKQLKAFRELMINNHILKQETFAKIVLLYFADRLGRDLKKGKRNSEWFKLLDEINATCKKLRKQPDEGHLRFFQLQWYCPPYKAVTSYREDPKTKRKYDVKIQTMDIKERDPFANVLKAWSRSKKKAR